MNGHIWVNNDERGGACFTICFPEGDPLPVLEPNNVIRDFSKPATDLSEPRKACYRAIRVLLVDDSSKSHGEFFLFGISTNNWLTVATFSTTGINLKVLQRMLQRLGVSEVVAMNDASEAVEVLLAENNPNRLPNLILSDLQMPGMDGFGFIAHLREITHFREPPIVMACTGTCAVAPVAVKLQPHEICSLAHYYGWAIVLYFFPTADWTSGSEERCVESGFDGVLRKPIILSALDEFLFSIVNASAGGGMELGRRASEMERNAT
jgi:CheY-like chemotaxis protein